MQYVSVPVSLLELGKPVPVDLWDPNGVLLLRHGHVVRSSQHRQMLADHGACVTESDAKAWRRSYERAIQHMVRDGESTDAIASAFMPSEILDADYVVPRKMSGDWLDLQEVLRIVLYQAADAGDALERLEGIEEKALELVRDKPDESLFSLFQALADDSIGYCATHALLCAVVCELTNGRLGTADWPRRRLFRAALVMNVGMARAQDGLARQASPLNDVQRRLIAQHPQLSFEILQKWGVVDPDELDLVRWHHEPDETRGMARNLDARRLLRNVDVYVAKMASRRTRLAMSPLNAAKSMFTSATSNASTLVSAIATSIGFYPPGTYVQLLSGERAVAVGRGGRANDAHVVAITNAGGIPVSRYIYRNSAEAQFAIRAPVNPEKIKLKVSAEKAYRAWREYQLRKEAGEL